MNKSSCVKTIPEWKWKCRFTIKTQNNNAFYEQKCYNSGFDASKKKKKFIFWQLKNLCHKLGDILVQVQNTEKKMAYHEYSSLIISIKPQCLQ